MSSVLARLRTTGTGARWIVVHHEGAEPLLLRRAKLPEIARVAKRREAMVAIARDGGRLVLALRWQTGALVLTSARDPLLRVAPEEHEVYAYAMKDGAIKRDRLGRPALLPHTSDWIALDSLSASE